MWSAPLRPICRPVAVVLAMIFASAAGPASAQALTPAFTYQGELRLSSGPATGGYDMQFLLYGAVSGGAQIGPTLTANNIAVSDGLFSVPLDFGAAQFAGERQWLEIRIRPAGSGSFETLSPRTEVTAAPYAWSAAVALANSVTTTSIVDGTIGSADINPAQVQRRVTGTCTGTNYLQQVNADGTVACAPAPEPGWSLGGNAGTAAGTDFVGTTDNQALVFRVDNRRALRIEPNIDSPNLIGGWSGNSVTAGVSGATIGGGGSGDTSLPNRVTDNYGTVGGGRNNQAGDGTGSVSNRAFATVGGGLSNTAGGDASTIAGGDSNTAAGDSSAIGGGNANTASGSASAVAGGRSNTASGRESAVGGGDLNRASGIASIVAGGSNNLAGTQHAVIGGGAWNAALGVWSSVSGGTLNCAGGNASWAGGYRAKIRPGQNPGTDNGCAGVPFLGGSAGDAGTFLWADFQDANFVSTGSNQFLVRASGGFGFNTNTIPPGIEAVFQSRGGANQNVDLYLRPATHGRGINLAMLPDPAGPAAFYVSQYDGSIFVDRILLESNGDFRVTAQAFKPGGGSWAVPSDARLKSGVGPLAGTLDRLLALKPVEFTYRPEVTPKSLYLPGRQVGFIAQEVEQVFPEWVSVSDEGWKTVGPRGFEALTVEALRELRAESALIDGAQSLRIAALETENARLRDESRTLSAESADLRAGQRRLSAENSGLRERLERLELLLGARTDEGR